MTKNHPHSLADLIMALNKLSPSDEEATHAIFEILGIRLESEFAKVELSEPHEKTPDSSAKKDEKTIQTEPIPTPSDSSKKSDETCVPSTLIPLEKSLVDPPEWFRNPLSLKSTVGSGGSTTSYPLQTLFVPNWTRAILASALSTYSNFGPIDIDELVKVISRYEPLREVPRLPWPTMVHGVQVLVDKNEALEPFYKDQTYLKSAVRKVAGSDRTQIMEFVGCPSWGVKSAKSDDWSDYPPPSSGTTVLLMTDLGILRDPFITDWAGVRDWLHFAAIVREAGCSLVAFVPYPPKRWPKPLQSAMKIVQWDRTTFTSTPTSTIQQIVKKDPQSLIDEFGRVHSNALRLAEVVSIAVRVEPELLRMARLTLVPEANAGDEADLWFSPLVQIRNVLGFVFDPEVVKILRKRLASQIRLLDDTWNKVFTEVHGCISPALFIEEEITWRALKDPNDLEIKNLLHRTLASIVLDDNKNGVSHWILRALPNLPDSVHEMKDSVHEMKITKMLKLGACLRLGYSDSFSSIQKSEISEPMPDWAYKLLPSNLGTVKIGVRFVENGVEFGDLDSLKGAEILELPATNPLRIDVSWKGKSGQGETGAIWLKHNEQITLPVDADEVELLTLSRDRYKLNKLQRVNSIEHDLCFVLMPFRPNFDKLHSAIIKPTMTEMGINCKRGDEIYGTKSVISDIWEYIQRSRVIIADLTGQNSNVLYELGLCHASNKDVIIITQSMNDVPFDLRHLRCIEYSDTQKGREKLREELRKTMMPVDIDEVELKSETNVQLLINTLKDENKSVLERVAEALENIRSETDVQLLINALKDEDKSVLESVAEALENIKSETAVKPLINTLTKWIYEKELEIGQKLLRTDPENVMCQSDVATTLNNLGLLLSYMGRIEEAKHRYEKALELREKLFKTYPENLGYQSNVATTLDNLGALLSDMGRIEEAKQRCEGALIIRETLLSADPENLGYQSNVATTLDNLSALLFDMGRIEEAKQRYEKALKMREKLLETDPENVAYQSNVATTLNNLGNLLSDMGRIEEAKNRYEKALEMREKLLENDPENVTYQSNVAMTLNNLGNLLKNMGRIEDAKYRYEKALEIYTEPMQYLTIGRKSESIIKLIQLNSEQAQKETKPFNQMNCLRKVFQICKENQDFFIKYKLKHERKLVTEAGLSAYIDFLMKNVSLEGNFEKRAKEYEKALQVVEKLEEIEDDETVLKLCSSAACYLRGRKLVNEALASRQPELELLRQAVDQFKSAKETYDKANVCFCVYTGLLKILEGIEGLEEVDVPKLNELVQKVDKTLPEDVSPSIRISFENIPQIFEGKDKMTRKEFLKELDERVSEIEYKALENLLLGSAEGHEYPNLSGWG